MVVGLYTNLAKSLPKALVVRPFLNFGSMRSIFIAIALLACFTGSSQHSVARIWNEALLEAIRNDFAKPTVHARNLFYTSVIQYDAWALFDPLAETYFMGKTVGNFSFPNPVIPNPVNVDSARHKIMSYACYRYLSYQFSNSPNAPATLAMLDTLMSQLGYSPDSLNTDFSTGDLTALGNSLGYFTIGLAQLDGSNQINDYANEYYQPVNPAISPVLPGNPNMIDPNFWQPLALLLFIDQAGNILTATPEFQGAEWGWVTPFALDTFDRVVLNTPDTTWNVYLDPGPPPLLYHDSIRSFDDDYYRWGFELVSKWGSHLDPADTTLWDISPATIGNIQSFPDPTDLTSMKAFYKEYDGGDGSVGHALNPHTGLPYSPNVVPRGDYTRVLAEFWADGPDSETPPGHWFTILNTVSDNPLTEKRWNGFGPILDDLEWDVKCYFALGGAVHDAAIAAWSVKRWYDYPRPISVIRWMADRGQCSDSTLMSYNSEGIQLDSGYIELVEAGDPLEGDSLQHIGKIKLRTWVGTDTTVSPDTTVFGVDWILAENWWPYQRPTFVTPPFAGYVSGHSTFSRAAAEVLTYVTGDPFFPGGKSEFLAPADSFLVFEQGPSVDVLLEWATYYDAADQCSLSRIWGGIHPPQDDIAGREIGKLVGPNAISYAESFFNGITTSVEPEQENSDLEFYPNPSPMRGAVSLSKAVDAFLLLDINGRLVERGGSTKSLSAPDVPGMYTLVYRKNGTMGALRLAVQ